MTQAEQLAEAKLALQRIKDIVCGDKFPRWGDDQSVMESRFRIADLCDLVLNLVK